MTPFASWKWNSKIMPDPLAQTSFRDLLEHVKKLKFFNRKVMIDWSQLLPLFLLEWN